MNCLLDYQVPIWSYMGFHVSHKKIPQADFKMSFSLDGLKYNTIEKGVSHQPSKLKLVKSESVAKFRICRVKNLKTQLSL